MSHEVNALFDSIARILEGMHWKSGLDLLNTAVLAWDLFSRAASNKKRSC
jgi:hypothetical protein